MLTGRAQVVAFDLFQPIPQTGQLVLCCNSNPDDPRGQTPAVIAARNSLDHPDLFEVLEVSQGGAGDGLHHRCDLGQPAAGGGVTRKRLDNPKGTINRLAHDCALRCFGAETSGACFGAETLGASLTRRLIHASASQSAVCQLISSEA